MEGLCQATFTPWLSVIKKLMKEDWKVDFNEDGLEKAEGFKLFTELILHQQIKRKFN